MWSYGPALLHLLCADGISSAQRREPKRPRSLQESLPHYGGQTFPLLKGHKLILLLLKYKLQHNRRRAGVRCFVVSDHVLDLEIQFTRGSKEEGEDW